MVAARWGSVFGPIVDVWLFLPLPSTSSGASLSGSVTAPGSAYPRYLPLSFILRDDHKTCYPFVAFFFNGRDLLYSTWLSKRRRVTDARLALVLCQESAL